MYHRSALIFFIDQSCMYQPSRMFGNGLEILFQRFGNPLHRHIGVFRNQKQYINTAMICYALEMSLHLLCGFHTSILPCLSTTFQHSQECWNVVEE